MKTHALRGALAALFLVAGCGDEGYGHFDASSDVERCREQLTELHQALVAFVEQHGHPPRGSGAAFLTELVTSGVIADVPGARRALSCPGPGAVPLPDAEQIPTARLRGEHLAYAARNTADFPLRSIPDRGTLALVACDNETGPNHDGVTNVLFADGSVQTLVLATLVERGRLPAETTAIVVGPDSPLAELRELSLD